MTEKEVKNLKGLSSHEVAERFKAFGYNELPAAKKRRFLTIVFEVFKEPMFLLLVGCGVIYLVLGDVREAIMLLAFVFVIIGITVSQETKTERALEALRDLSSPRALVIRDGQSLRIAGREVVPDDLIIIAEGDRVPADGILVWGLNVSIDESFLTGESVAVRKAPAEGETEMDRPGGDDTPFVYSGSLVVSGQGIARAVSTGVRTEMGKIGKTLQALEPEETLLQKETGRLVRNLTIVGAILCVIVVVVYGLTRGNWLEGVLSGLTLAMAILPEEFPVVLTIFLALGAWRISRKNVLTRRTAAVETLGSATVLCTDKTGTLTQNRMSIQEIHANGKFFSAENLEQKQSLPENFHRLIEYAILASKKDPFDPMEKALVEFGNRTLYDTEHLHADWELVREYPLSKQLLALSHVWKDKGSSKHIIAAKGSPEAIIDLCHLDAGQAESVMRDVTTLAAKGLRVLGVAESSFDSAKLPGEQHDFVFKFIGLVGLADPIRPTVPLAIRECYAAGIRVVMITGDYPITAKNIAEQIGIRNREEIITGPELDAMSDDELRERLKTVNIFSRVVPEQKLRLVNALKANGEIVAMTGDGVNDAPALKSAHIGIAMGARGTDVARESASLVLLDDDFSSIEQAVKTGRRIFDNLKKAMSYIFSIHVPIAGLSLIPILLGWPVLLYPVHIVFLELIIDPACSIVFEAEDEEDGIMDRPPRKSDEPIVGRRTLLISILQGVFVLAAVLAVYRITRGLNWPEHDSLSITFATLIFSNLSLIMTNRSWQKSIFAVLGKPNKALWWVVGGTVAFLLILMYVPVVRNLFHFTSTHPLNLLIAMGIGMLSVAWFEILKLVFRRKGKNLLQDSKTPDIKAPGVDR